MELFTSIVRFYANNIRFYSCLFGPFGDKKMNLQTNRPKPWIYWLIWYKKSQYLCIAIAKVGCAR